ncbi:uncharacterized protein A4U43_C08F19930 [Asparagus officinalis]|nr:uncharacterized protein A4U43_C08F19930 [Asparagus officinalis]
MHGWILSDLRSPSAYLWKKNLRPKTNPLISCHWIDLSIGKIRSFCHRGIRHVPILAGELVGGASGEVHHSSSSVRFQRGDEELVEASRSSEALPRQPSRLRPRDIRTTPAIYSSNQSDPADADYDKNRRSPSVVARLMGLEALPDSNADGESIKKAELRRSASESRVSRDLQRFVEGSFFQKPPPPQDYSGDGFYKFRSADFRLESKQTPPPAKQSQPVAIQRRSYYNAQDFFPEPNRTGSRSLYGEIEKRLRMRGIDEPAKDLETLKQILEALQLKGLLHSNSKASNQQNDRPIVVMKPIPRPVRRSESEPSRSAAGRRNPVRSPSPRSSPDPNPRRKPGSNHLNGRSSPVNSLPRSSPRRTSPDLVTSRSPRNRGSVKERVCSPAEDDTATTISESSISSFDLERTRVEYRAGRSLLERCDKLLHNIAAFTSPEQLTATDQQPSPVSVLDSSYLNEEGSPSPVKKRSIEFKDPLAEWEEDWVTGSRPDFMPESEYADFAYVANVLQAYDRYPATSSSDVFHFLEKRRSATDSLNGSTLHRRLLFDAVIEILVRKRHVSPWESFSRRRPLSGGAQLIKDVTRQRRCRMRC